MSLCPMNEYMASDMASKMVSWTDFIPYVVSGIIGLLIGIGIGSAHKQVRHSRQPVEHCILLDTAPDYRDVQCPSGEWRYIGDTLRIRLHT